jgi:o-succinylbenzoate synthase
VAGLARSTNPRHSAGAAEPESGRIYQIGLHTRFRGVTVRQGLVWRGAAGWAEWSPFLDYRTDEARIWLRAAMESAEIGWPDPVRATVPVNCTIPAVDAEVAYTMTAESGCRTAKVKVAEHGQALADDLGRVEAVRHALGPTGRVRVDANGAWDVDTARAAIRQLARFDLEYVEQPCPHVEDLAELRRRLSRDGIGVLIAADESIRRSNDPYRVAELRAADVVVLKVQPLGGVRACLEIAERIGLPVVVSSALETSVGIRAGLALAASLPELPYACGLNTVPLLIDDLVEPSLVATDGYLEVRDLVVDPLRLSSAAAPTDVAEAWRARRREVRRAMTEVESGEGRIA